MPDAPFGFAPAAIDPGQIDYSRFIRAGTSPWGWAAPQTSSQNVFGKIRDFLTPEWSKPFAGMSPEQANREAQILSSGVQAPGKIGPGYSSDLDRLGAAALDVGSMIAPELKGAAVAKPLLGIFAGAGAKTADRAALTAAQEMAAKGAKPLDIWNQTGWFQGADSKWRFEIPDDASISKGLPATGERGKLASALGHPELFNAYPDLAKMLTTSKGEGWTGGEYIPPEGGGWFSRAPKTEEEIRIGGSDKDIRSKLLHEAQHAVQRREGFMLGAADRDDWENYLKSAGEVEPRNVQSRMNMSPEERKANPPWTTEDVPREQQIIRGQGGGPQMSIEKPPPSFTAYHGSPSDFRETAVPAFRHDQTGEIVTGERGQTHFGVAKSKDLEGGRIDRVYTKYTPGFFHQGEFVPKEEAGMESTDLMTPAEHQAWLATLGKYGLAGMATLPALGVLQSSPDRKPFGSFAPQ